MLPAVLMIMKKNSSRGRANYHHIIYSRAKSRKGAGRKCARAASTTSLFVVAGVPSMFPFILKDVSKDLGKISVWIAVFTSVALFQRHTVKGQDRHSSNQTGLKTESVF